MLEVHQIMTKKVITITEEKTAYIASKLMKDKKIGCIVVVDKDKVVGIATEKDFLFKVVARDRLPSNVKISEIMTKNPIVVNNKYEKIWRVNKIMTDNNIRRLPIVENGKLIGIVTASDLLRQAY
jgi:CBS domain-containing protein